MEERPMTFAIADRRLPQPSSSPPLAVKKATEDEARGRLPNRLLRSSSMARHRRTLLLLLMLWINTVLFTGPHLMPLWPNPPIWAWSYSAQSLQGWALPEFPAECSNYVLFFFLKKSRENCLYHIRRKQRCLTEGLILHERITHSRTARCNIMKN